MSQQQALSDERYAQVHRIESHGPPIKSESESPDLGARQFQPNVGSPQYRSYEDSYSPPAQVGWYPAVLLPSELRKYHQPPTYLFSEIIPIADPSSFHDLPAEYTHILPMTTLVEPRFAARANELINQRLNRQPGGTSVVDPDSILGESGRLYHGYKDGKYYLPNDAAEQERLDLQHEMYRLLFDGWLALAPMSRPPRYVLDIGTGTGLWARDFAEQNPSSYVIGSDLSVIQPDTTLSNLVWSKDDAEDAWLFPLPTSHLVSEHLRDSNVQAHLIQFDYIHLRLVFTCFNSPQTVIKHAFDNLSPGGLLEFQDLSPEIYQNNPAFEGNYTPNLTAICRGAMSVGRDLHVAEKYKQWLEEAGFVEVVETRFVLPCHQWMKDPKFKQIGAFNQQNFTEGVRGGGWKMLKASGMTTEEIELLISQVKTELRIRKNHIYGYVYVVYGRKPHPSELHASASSVPARS
ncbi:hypothetical protein TruAng_006660 [Truncatella angustata]|nr:hypothetical protein TruAng_006660 [Truncatella angustata]